MASREVIIKTLIDMGFQKEKAETSVLVTGNRGIDLAVEWLSKQTNEVESSTSQEGSASSNTLEKDISTKEKKPLAEEENKELKKKMEDSLNEKRKESEVKEKGEELEREKIQIQPEEELFVSKRKLEDETMDDRKREKQEEKIDLDQVSGVEQPKEVLPATVNPQKHSNNYNETKLQIRLTNGQSMIQTFNVKEMLAAVRVYIELNRSDGDAPFCLMTNFPRKVFSKDDYEKPLDQLGLVPRAVVIVAKLPQ